MKEIVIYLEGGGDTAQQKAELRSGMDALLAPQKNAARVKKLGWRTVPCGGRQQAYEAFRNALERADEDTLVTLLVDSEDPIAPEVAGAEEADAAIRVQHLAGRDGWDLSAVDGKQVHLMVCCMEAWIVADPQAVADYYGKDFHHKVLPNRRNLEDEPKPALYDKLKRATEDTKKGAYAKIKHACKLLARIDPLKVGRRCPRFLTLTTWLAEQIGSA